MDSYVLSGVTIGHGAVIAARSTVSKDIPPYAIAGGNPARVIRYRFPPHIIEGLLSIAWWDWPLEQIRACWPLMLSNRVEEFVQLYSAR